jgi:hypothetical protein
MATRKRGSDALLQAWQAGGIEIDDDLMKSLSSRLAQVDFHHVLTRGIPKPDWFSARFNAGPAEKAGSVITDLLSVIGESRIDINLRVFPRGIPWPGELLVDLSVNQREQF